MDLLPHVEPIRRLCATAREWGVEAVFLTPVATPPGLSRIKRLLSDLTQAGESPAVVFNDWGVARLLRDSFPSLRRRAGRLMNRGLRDPRLIGQWVGVNPATGDRGRRTRLLLARMGTVAVETDPDLDGTFLGDGTEGMQRVLYLPYAFAASGRNCLVKADGAHGIDGCFTRGLGTTCTGRCRGKWHRVERADTDLNLWRAGNTLLYEVPLNLAIPQINHADRIVVHPGATS